MIRRLSTCAVALLAACERPRVPPLRPELGVLMPDSVALELVDQCSRPAPHRAEITGIWRPTPAQIRALEAALPDELGRALEAQSFPRPQYRAEHIRLYHRQYAGLVVRGKRIIYVNGAIPPFREAAADSGLWRALPEAGCDGGIGFFGVEYDPASDTFEHLEFNGVA